MRNKNAPRLIGVNYLYTLKGNFYRPMGIAIDVGGNLYIADSGKNVIHILNNQGKILESIGRFGWRTGEFDNPADVSMDSQLRLYIADSGNNRIQMYSLTNRQFSVIAGETISNSVESLTLSQPQSIANDSKGYVYIADTWNHRILKIDRSGRLKMEFDSQQLKSPQGMAIDLDDNIYISDSGNNRIHKLDFSGNIINTWGEEGSAKSQFQNPYNLIIDRFGYIYVIDRGNRRVQTFSQEGSYITEFGQPFLEEPIDIAIDNDYHAYITDIAAGDIKVFKIIYEIVSR